MEREIKFTKNGHSHLVGNFGPGDVFRGSEAQCRHFVDDAQCAEFSDTVVSKDEGRDEVQADADEQQPVVAGPAVKKGKKK